MANRFALGDLLDDRELGLELLVGGEEQRRRAVRGAHSIEVEHPAAWLERDWVMLTTGIVLRRSAAAQRQLVVDLDEKGVAALGFGIGAYFQRVPTALLEEARAREFPVFAVPFPVGFHQIEGKVHGSLLSSDLRIHARVAALQDHLLDSFADDRPQETLIERLAEVLDASAAIAGPGGRIETSAGKGPWGGLWAEIEQRPHTLLDFEVDGWHAIGVPIYGRDAPSARWLVVTRRRELAQPLTKHAARVATRLLAALTRLHEAERRQERAIRAALLEILLEPLGDEAARALPMRLEAYGFDAREPSRGIAIADDSATEPETGSALELGRRLESAGVPHLVAERDALTLAVVQAPLDRIREIVVPFLEREPVSDAAAGCGRAAVGARDLAQSIGDARLILSGMRGAAEERWRAFEDLDLGMLLASEVEPGTIQPKIDEILERLDRRPGVREAVVAYFESDLDVGKAAFALGIHPNSVRYRLSRAEEELGRSLRNPATIAAVSISLAVSAKRASDGRDG